LLGSMCKLARALCYACTQARSVVVVPAVVYVLERMTDIPLSVARSWMASSSSIPTHYCRQALPARRLSAAVCNIRLAVASCEAIHSSLSTHLQQPFVAHSSHYSAHTLTELAARDGMKHTHVHTCDAWTAGMQERASAIICLNEWT